MAVSIINPTGRNPLYHQYPGQCQPQAAFIELDCEQGTLRADINYEIGNAVPEGVYNHRIRRWQVPNDLTCKAIKKLFQEIRQDAETILAGYEARWNGSNFVGLYSPEAEAAWDKIEWACQEASNY